MRFSDTDAQNIRISLLTPVPVCRWAADADSAHSVGAPLIIGRNKQLLIRIGALSRDPPPV